MINGLGVVGWGVGGIEAEAGMLGQPVYFLTPEVVGVHLTGQASRRRHRNRSRLAHHPDAARAKGSWEVRRILRRRRSLVASAGSRHDRKHVAGVRRHHWLFPGRSGIGELFARNWSQRRTMRRVRELFPRAKNVWHAAQGRNRLQRRSGIRSWPRCSRALPDRSGRRIGSIFPSSATLSASLLQKPIKDGGYGKENVDLATKHLVQLNGSAPRDDEWLRPTMRPGIDPGEERNKAEMVTNRPTPDTSERFARFDRGSISSWRKQDWPRQCFDRGHHQLHEHQQSERDAGGRFAGEEGGRARPARRSGSENFARARVAGRFRIISTKTGLQTYLDQLGFNLVGYGCTTCIGNSGPLHPKIEKAIHDYDLVAASVLSGNRNFEARVHQNIKANFLMSPPLVVAFALAGRGRSRSDERADRQGQRRERNVSARSLAQLDRSA